MDGDDKSSSKKLKFLNKLTEKKKNFLIKIFQTYIFKIQKN